jgi:hypothetical protein
VCAITFQTQSTTITTTTTTTTTTTATAAMNVQGDDVIEYVNVMVKK